LAPLIVLCTGCDAIFGLRDVSKKPDPDAFIAPLDRNLVAHYTLDELVGGNLVTDSANHHDAICVQQGCPVPDVGHATVGGSLVFNVDPANIGSPQYLQIAAAADLELSPEYTVALWIRVDGLDGGCVIQQTYGAAMDNAWQLCFDASGSPSFYSVENRVHTMLTHVGDDAPNGEWTHFALVHDSSAKIMYRNGVELGRDVIGPASFTEGAATYIGADVDAGSNVTDPFEGAVDEVRIYARALDPGELAQIVAGDP
jgi:hypothetical protein